MSILSGSHLYAIVCNRGNHMQLDPPILDTNVQILDTKNGYHDENRLRDDERGLSQKPRGSSAGIRLKHASVCIAPARSLSKEKATDWRI